MNVPKDFLQEILEALRNRGEYEIQIDIHTNTLKTIHDRLTRLEIEQNENTGKRKAYSAIVEFLKALALVAAGALLGKAL